MACLRVRRDAVGLVGEFAVPSEVLGPSGCSVLEDDIVRHDKQEPVRGASEEPHKLVDVRIKLTITIRVLSEYVEQRHEDVSEEVLGVGLLPSVFLHHAVELAECHVVHEDDSVLLPAVDVIQAGLATRRNARVQYESVVRRAFIEELEGVFLGHGPYCAARSVLAEFSHEESS